jgi:hypothetical protein
MQFDQLREILNRLVNRKDGDRLQVCWTTMPAPGDVVTLTLGANEEFQVWRWSDKWVPCGTVTCSILQWNCELIGDFYRQDDGQASRLVWMPQLETPPEPAGFDDLSTSVGHLLTVEYEADLSDALGFLLGKGLKPLWCEETQPFAALDSDLLVGGENERDRHVRRCVLLTSADERRGCQWCW